MNESVGPARHERRWRPALAIIAVQVLLTALPNRFRLFPPWFPYTVSLAILAPMLAVGFTGASRWLRIERTAILLFFMLAQVLMVIVLWRLFNVIAYKSNDVNGVWLLSSSAAMWLVNIITYALLYWQVDRGGPEARVSRPDVKPDWLFAQDGAPEKDVPAGWRPTFPDYLFLAFTTSTAFSPTDTLPLTVRAKMLMMFESMISLVTIVLVAARAINILG
jgi:hypothetical protein